MSGSTIRSDHSPIDVELYKSLDDFISEVLGQLKLDHFIPDTSAIITVQNTIDVVNNIMDWIKEANNTDLLKKPIISVVSER